MTAGASRLLDPTLYADDDPFALYAELRRTAPVCWVDREGGGFWAVTTHPEVSSIGADPVRFCSSHGASWSTRSARPTTTPPTMMHTDPPQHTRYRRLVQPGFKPSMVRLMEAGVTAKAKALIDPIESGEAIDVVQALSIPFPLQVICELLGVDGSQWPRFFEWSEAVIPGRKRAFRGGAGGAAGRDVGVPRRGGRGAARVTGRGPRVGAGQRGLGAVRGRRR